MAKLTKAQRDVLEQAALVARFRKGSGADDGNRWFTPMRHDAALVYAHTNTCKALCGKGLLEYRVYMEAINGYPAILEFSITDAGQRFLAASPAGAAGEGER